MHVTTPITPHLFTCDLPQSHNHTLFTRPHPIHTWPHPIHIWPHPIHMWRPHSNFTCSHKTALFAWPHSSCVITKFTWPHPVYTWSSHSHVTASFTSYLFTYDHLVHMTTPHSHMTNKFTLPHPHSHVTIQFTVSPLDTHNPIYTSQPLSLHHTCIPPGSHVTTPFTYDYPINLFVHWSAFRAVNKK